jgi:hypothetical protein
MLRVIALLLLSLSINCFASIGKVTEEKGSSEIVRNKLKLDAKMNAGVESMDSVQTANGIVGITFEDDTKVRVTQHSKLVIDDFVYDPKSKGTGKLAMKVALGTVRYASGNIAKENNKNVDVKTPTATVAVRGTAFSMTVDEVGASTIILLPNQDGTVGEIEVRTAMGSVTLNKAFQATYAGLAEAKPLAPAILNLTESMIDNMLIVKPPKEIVKALQEENTRDNNPLSFNALDYNPLNEQVFKDELKFNELNINDLDTNNLTNALENIFDISSFPVGYNPTTQLYILDRNTYWYIERRVKDLATILINKDRGYDITLIQDSTTLYIKNQDSTTNKIIIKQISR